MKLHWSVKRGGIIVKRTKSTCSHNYHRYHHHQHHKHHFNSTTNTTYTDDYRRHSPLPNHYAFDDDDDDGKSWFLIFQPFLKRQRKLYKYSTLPVRSCWRTCDVFICCGSFNVQRPVALWVRLVIQKKKKKRTRRKTLQRVSNVYCASFGR